MKRGTPVNVYVSTGPPMTTVPEVTVGEPVGKAVAALRKQGLVAQVYGPGHRVFTISDTPGERVPLSSIVYVYTI